MEDSLRPQEPYSNRRNSVLSCPAFHSADAISLGTLRRQISTSDSAVRSHTTYNIRIHTIPASYNEQTTFPLEMLFKTTDIVLVMCSVVFVISSIASIAIWMYGFPWGNLGGKFF